MFHAQRKSFHRFCLIRHNCLMIISQQSAKMQQEPYELWEQNSTQFLNYYEERTKFRNNQNLRTTAIIYFIENL